MTMLPKGANTALSGALVDIAVQGAQAGSVDLLVFQLDEVRTVRTDADLVFFNAPVSPEGAVRLVAGDRVTIDLQRVPTDVEILAIAVALDESVPHALGAVPSLGVTVTDGAVRVDAPASGLKTERAALLVEVYRRHGGWKVRSVSAGWAEGLAALVREHGVTVDETVDEAPAGPASVLVPSITPVAVAGVRVAKGEEALSLEKRTTLTLRKTQVARVLLTKGAADVRARVVIVMDKSGSMTKLYKNKAVHRVIERMVPIAVQLDDDGALEVYLYAARHLRLPDLRVADLEHWPDAYLHMRGKNAGVDFSALGGTNEEPPVMAEVMSTLRPGDPLPTLVLFFTDGGFSRKREIKSLMTQAAALPAFWQFVGIGKANYGLLEDLDEMDGRVVDNAGFFHLDDLDRIGDAELYERLLAEFPSWIRAARAARVLG